MTTANTPPVLFTDVFTDVVKELVAIGAAIGSNCEPCFKYHFNEARKLGVSKADIRLAVEVAEKVKAAPAQSISGLCEKYLHEAPAKAACCGCASESDEPAAAGEQGKSPCC